MKFFTTVILAAAAVNAVALPEANPDASACEAPGQPCWVVKRAAEAFADVINEDHLAARGWNNQDCKRPWQPCWKAKRDAEAFASALASAQQDSSDFTSSLGLERRFPEPEAETETEIKARGWNNQDCKRPFQPCWKAKRAAEAEAEAACNMAGAPCSVVKRAAEAVDLVVRSPQNNQDCKRPFQPCWKAKRDVAKLQNFARYVLDDEE